MRVTFTFENPDGNSDGFYLRVIQYDSSGNVLATAQTGWEGVDSPDAQKVLDIDLVSNVATAAIGIYDLSASIPVNVAVDGTVVGTFDDMGIGEWQELTVNVQGAGAIENIMTAVMPIVVIGLMGFMMTKMFKF